MEIDSDAVTGYSAHMDNPKRALKCSLSVVGAIVLGGLLGVACGDDDSGGDYIEVDVRQYDFSVSEVVYQKDSYRCITNRTVGSMWCENVSLDGGN
jgi:hypothetical protein